MVKIASNLVEQHKIEVIDLRDYNVAIYQDELERNHGIPGLITNLQNQLNEADGFIISSPEHNSSIPAFFKNIIDWLSRIKGKTFGQKPTLLMGTSPGGRGAITNFTTLESIMPYWGAEIVGTFSLPSFFENCPDNKLKTEYEDKLKTLVKKLEEAII